ncbi:MAG: RsmE family RNA methyltransferase [Bryobacteraceae bacterium]|nr:RsmE family RNA methyltransferase [Bryobacteraceae bacterium]
MARRLFFVDGVHSGRAELTGGDAAHLTRVLRVEPGERYEISDNQRRYLAEVESARKSLVVFRVLETLPSPAPLLHLHLLAALVKFDRFEWVLEKAAELGVESITPVIAGRSEKGLDQAAPKRSERWKRILLESSQQCRRTTLPVLNPATTFAGALAQDGLRLLLDEEATMPVLHALPAARHATDGVFLLVGPEGGWTGQERQSAREALWQPVSLGPNILRAETAAAAAMAVIVAAWEAAQAPASPMR